jgi:hypothetical protein
LFICFHKYMKGSVVNKTIGFLNSIRGRTLRSFATRRFSSIVPALNNFVIGGNSRGNEKLTPISCNCSQK